MLEPLVVLILLKLILRDLISKSKPAIPDIGIVGK